MGRRIRVAIIGAGFGGVGAGVYLTKSGFSDFVIFEKSDGVGGVWHHNRYPGAAVDTFSIWYSYGFKPFDWPRSHATQDVLVNYINEAVDEYGFRDRIRLNTAVRSATWDEATHSYELVLADGETERFDVVVSAVGLFNVPNYPTWPGLSDFQGPVFHAARWEPQHDLTGKRVALVGAGSSGVQIAPEIAPIVGELLIIQRDPNWMLPKENRPFTDEERERRRSRLRYRLERFTHARAEAKVFRGGDILRPGTKQNEYARLTSLHYLESVLSDRPELLESVLPSFPYYGKRPVKADGFYESLRRDNVHFYRREVASVDAKGLFDTNGDFYPVDVIVMATGFRVAEYLGEIDVFGRNGISLHGYWDSVGGPEAFLGLTVPNFPNFYMLYGPNTNSGQIVFWLECQARFVARNLKRMRRSGSTALEVRPALHDMYNRRLQRRLNATVYPLAKNYLKARSGKIVVPYARAMTHYWRMTRLLRWVSMRAQRLPSEVQAPVSDGQSARVAGD